MFGAEVSESAGFFRGRMEDGKTAPLESTGV